MSLVSIILPSYNSSKFLEESINSVLNQSYDTWELIIVDDDSTDGSKEIITKFSKLDDRIKSLFLEKNIGAAKSRNIAIKQSKGKYIAFLDSDDIWVDNKLEKQILFMKEKQVAFSFTTYQRINENKTKFLKTVRSPKQMTYSSYLKNTIIGCSTVIIDREKTGDFQMPNIRSSHDMALWLLIMKRGFLAFGLDKNLAYYRIVSSSNTANKIRAVKEVWDVYRKVEKLNIIYSVYNFIGYAYNAIKKRM